MVTICLGLNVLRGESTSQLQILFAKGQPVILRYYVFFVGNVNKK